MTAMKLSRLSSAPAIAVSALILCGSQLWAQPLALPQAQGTFMTFDAPGASGTFSVSINPAGEILGASSDSSGAVTGFLRSPQGTFTTFNAPGATEYEYQFFGEPSGSNLNPSGEAMGFYGDANGTLHGFVRDLLGPITTFDAPDADITPGDFAGTLAVSINPAGETAGFYFDAQGNSHGFVRDANGHVTELDAPGASSLCFGLTTPTSINAVGAITGSYNDSVCNNHGFLREPNGVVIVVDIPGFSQTVPETINDGGEIAGFGFDAATGAGHGFVRDRGGLFS